jgi:DNA-binding NarL/FixJ family response regulator
MIRVLICDDQTVVREGLAAILGTDPEIEVVGTAGNGQEVLEMMARARPDVVLLDLQMPIMNGVQTTRRLQKDYPRVYVLILTTFADDAWLFDAIEAGASGYLLKDTRRDDLVAAVKGTAAGKSFLDPAVAGKVMQQAATRPAGGPQPGDTAETFTERELQILGLVALGNSNPEIAAKLHLAPGTVRNYVSTILTKLGVSDRTQAAVVAVRRGLVAKGDG